MGDPYLKGPVSNRIRPLTPFFKGGTSLSKGWKLISRFSEDIDLAIDRRTLGYSDDLSRSKIKALKKEAARFTSTKLKDALIQQLHNFGVPDKVVKVSAEMIRDTQPDKDPQTLFLAYPSLFESLPYLPSEVKIEVSALSLREPFMECEIGTLLQEYFPNTLYEENPFIVCAVEPQRTFLEKLFLLHEDFLRPHHLLKAERKSRHLYDLAMLMNTPHATTALKDLALYEKIVNHRSLYYRLSHVNYSKHAPETIDFIPDLALLPRFENDYKTMREQMIYGDAPAFPELIDMLRELRWNLRNIKPIRLPYGFTIESAIDFMSKHLPENTQYDYVKLPLYPPKGTLLPYEPAHSNLTYFLCFVKHNETFIFDDIKVEPVNSSQ